MADADVQITPGSGTKIDTRTVGAGTDEHRQVMVVGSPTTAANVAEVSAAGALLVQGYQAARNAYAVTGTGNSGSLACANYNIASVVVSGTYAGVTLIFEGSDDGGTTWVQIQGVRTDLFVAESSSGSLTNTTRGWDIPIGAFTHFRVRASTWTSGTAAVGISFQSMPYEPSPTVGIGGSYMGRSQVQYWASGAAAGATGVETAISLTRSGAIGAATSSGNSFTPTAGKRLRLTGIVFAARGNATATAQVTTFSLRANTAGAVTTSSNPFLQARVATPATALAWDRFVVPLDEGLEILGDGTLQIGCTANAVFTTNAPTWDVSIVGFEY